MITIYVCNIYTKEYGDYAIDFAKLSNRKQWRHIKDVNKANGCIATLAHRKSILRKYFIEPNLKDGYVVDGKYELKLIGFTIQYELISKFNNYITEEEKTYFTSLLQHKILWKK